jgi:hypothetical protein
MWKVAVIQGYRYLGKRKKLTLITELFSTYMEPLCRVSRGKTEEGEAGKRDYRHRSRTDCGAGEVDGFWLDLLAYSDSSRRGCQERLGRYIWGDRAS